MSPAIASRQAAAHVRQLVRACRSVGEQLEVLDGRLGRDVGARRERARLTAEVRDAA
jgi:hypothetical protein